MTKLIDFWKQICEAKKGKSTWSTWSVGWDDKNNNNDA